MSSSATIQMPPTITASLVVKIGKPHSDSRSTVDKEATQLLLNADEDSFASFRCRISDRVTSIVERYEQAQASSRSKSKLKFDDNFLVLLKPAINTKQCDYTVIDSSNFKSSIATSWTNHCKRSNAGNFTLDIFVYLEKYDTYAQQIRRATTERVANMAQRILGVDRAQQPGPSELQYVSITYARQITEPDFVNLPENHTVHQLRHIDNEMARLARDRANQQSLSDEECRNIRLEINGTVVPMRINIADLRTILGLPQYDLYSPYRAPVPINNPAVNVEDVDHNDDDEDMD
ncbi:hypothetical protein AC1031_008143 [Aphanomyces cochlioides]|nr:hypothetical protein AC1031_008143 [Aphanomyces cochlioides]